MNIMPVNNNPNNPAFGLKYKNVDVDVESIGKHASVATIRELATTLVPQMLRNPKRCFDVKLWRDAIFEPLGIKIRSFDQISKVVGRTIRFIERIRTSETRFMLNKKDAEPTLEEFIQKSLSERTKIAQQQRKEAIDALKAALAEPKKA